MALKILRCNNTPVPSFQNSRSKCTLLQASASAESNGSHATPCPLCRAPVRAAEVIEMPSAVVSADNHEENSDDRLSYPRIGPSSKVPSPLFTLSLWPSWFYVKQSHVQSSFDK